MNKDLKVHLEHVVNSMPGVFYWKSREGVYLGCNNFKMPGFSDSRSIIGKTDYDLYRKEEADLIHAHDLYVITSGETLHVEEYVTLPTGEIMQFIVDKMPLKDHAGNTIGLIGTSLDITELKNQQAAVLLAKEQLKEAEIREEQFKMLASLSGMLAHELKTPLSSVNLAITGFKKDLTELLVGYAFYTKNCQNIAKISPAKLEKLEKSLTHVETSLAYATNTISTILTGFHTVISNEGMSVKSFNVESTVREAIQNYPMLEKERALINIKSGDVLYGMGDVNMVIHVLHNLLKNALQAIKEAGRGFIQIWYKKDNKNIVIYFEDTALGISAEQLEKIFTPFYTTKKKSAFSIGLGLYFCKLALEKMSGSISCVSKPSQYARFIVSLPSK